MNDLLKPSRLERAVPIVIIANLPVWLFGVLILGFSGEYGHWDGASFAGLAMFTYLPAAGIGAAFAALTNLRQQVRKRLLWVLFAWGLLTLALAAMLVMSRVTA